MLGIMEQCDTMIDLIKYRSVTFSSWSSDFAIKLECQCRRLKLF